MAGATVMMPPAAMYTADATASFNGMMPPSGHLATNAHLLPGGHLTTGGGAGLMMMNADGEPPAGWSTTSPDVSNYLSAKAAHMVCVASNCC